MYEFKYIVIALSIGMFHFFLNGAQNDKITESILIALLSVISFYLIDSFFFTKENFEVNSETNDFMFQPKIKETIISIRDEFPRIFNNIKNKSLSENDLVTVFRDFFVKYENIKNKFVTELENAAKDIPQSKTDSIDTDTNSEASCPISEISL